MSRVRLRPYAWARLLTIALLVGVGISNLVFAVTDWHLHDMEVYEAAAWRIRDGQPLYGGDVDELSAYRYAPWFAWAWVPLTYLPDAAIDVGWSAVMVASSVAALWPIRNSVALLALFGPILFGISAIGNVHPLMMAGLVWGLPRRWGWAAVGLAASLKLVPLAYCAVFIAQRRWRSVFGALLLTVALWLPALFLPIDPITFESGVARTLALPLWLTVAAAAALVTLWLARSGSSHTALAAGVAACLALPRLFVYEISLVLPGATWRNMVGLSVESDAGHETRSRRAEGRLDIRPDGELRP